MVDPASVAESLVGLAKRAEPSEVVGRAHLERMASTLDITDDGIGGSGQVAEAVPTTT